MPRLVINPATGELDEVDTGGSGSTGPPGQPGATGEQGEDGADGQPGQTGQTGATGTTGSTGAQGSMGTPGQDGIPGDDGIDGLPGLKGDTGATGATGATGLQGAQGIPGNDGQDGEDGLPGQDGDPGITGPAGVQGVPGVDGTVDSSDFEIPLTFLGNLVGAVVSGAGVAGRVAFWTGPTTLGNDADFLWNSTTNLLTIGRLTAVGITHQFGSAAAGTTVTIGGDLFGASDALLTVTSGLTGTATIAIGGGGVVKAVFETDQINVFLNYEGALEFGSGAGGVSTTRLTLAATGELTSLAGPSRQLTLNNASAGRSSFIDSAHAANLDYTLPSTLLASGFLQTTAGGTLSWAAVTPSTINAAPAGQHMVGSGLEIDDPEMPISFMGNLSGSAVTSGHGVIGQVAYWKSATEITSDVNFLWDVPVGGSNILRIGTTAQDGQVRATRFSDLGVAGANSKFSLDTNVTNGLKLASDSVIIWTDNLVQNVGTPDIGLKRASTGVLAVTDGAASTGNLTANQLTSTVAVGTPPLVVTSTNRVVNLNADLVDGLHADAFARRGEFMTGTMMDGLEEREMPLRFGNFINEESVGRSLYLLLAGRTGTTNNSIISTDSDGTIAGSGTTAKGLILRPNTADLTTGTLTFDGIVSLYPNIGNNFGTKQLLTFSPAVTFDSGSSTLQGLVINPTITINATPVVVTVRGVSIAGAGITYNAAPAATIVQLMQSTISHVLGVGVGIAQSTIDDASTFNTLNNIDTSATPIAVMRTVDHHTIFKVTGATGKLTVTEDTAVVCRPTLNAITAGGVARMTNGRGLWCQTATLTGSGTNTLDAYGAVDVDALTGNAASVLYGMRSALVAATNNYFLKDDGGAQWKAVGKFTTYNNVAVVAFGVPAIVDSQTVGPSGADLVDTNFTNTATTGLYRIEVYVLDTTSAIGAGAVTVNIKFNDGTAAQTVTVGPVVLTTAGAFAQATIFARRGSGNITYGVTHTGIFSTAQYTAYLTCERLV